MVLLTGIRSGLLHSHVRLFAEKLATKVTICRCQRHSFSDIICERCRKFSHQFGMSLVLVNP